MELRTAWSNTKTKERSKKLLVEILQCRGKYETEWNKRKDLVREIYNTWLNVKEWRKNKVGLGGI